MSFQELKYKVIVPERGMVVKITDWLWFCFHGKAWVKMDQTEIDKMEKQQKEKKNG